MFFKLGFDPASVSGIPLNPNEHPIFSNSSCISFGALSKKLSISVSSFIRLFHSESIVLNFESVI